MRHIFTILVVLAGTLFIGSCQTQEANNIIPLKVAEMTPELYADIKNNVAQNLKDPYSAVFGPAKAMVRLRNGAREVVVCGYVNAKNSFGGYGGMQPYIGVYSFTTKRFNLVAMGDESTNAALLVRGSCRGSGIAI